MRTSFMILASALVSTVAAAGPLSPAAQEKCTRLTKYCRNCSPDCSKHWRQNGYDSSKACQTTECWAADQIQGTNATTQSSTGWCTKVFDAVTCLAGCKEDQSCEKCCDSAGDPRKT
ncbi:BZ3500_MvSof-1268-A1-R1_Chr5-1g07595 [Microbotryum saponariae]|uniref:BZ3500_MvSof-1268-A1-R1_Chr5-1g07595 protein n=1 Tax=Microbotryum saponariae TaxID=289078 RepID=A0A2X0NIF9_9BASI|nr:BZ3500_MvSof-1268-A1-R1_Chr5-1g07595 [Microbotryum saponariae]SDA05466.1 BZ3501_MvSof-1269-A2-R1_Chr5-2g07419 [Microbotryum saponariae]